VEVKINHQSIHQSKSPTQQQKYDSVIIAGDFNLPTIKWDNGNALVEPGFNHELAAEVVDSFTENNLYKMVDFATFTNFSGFSGNVVDFIITDQPIRILQTGQSSPLVDTQKFHIIIKCEFRIKNAIPTNTFSSKILNYKKGNYDSFNNFIATHDWNALLKPKLSIVLRCLQIGLTSVNPKGQLTNQQKAEISMDDT